MMHLNLANETPSANVEQAFAIPYSAYQIELWQMMMIGTVIGSLITLAVVLIFVAAAPRVIP